MGEVARRILESKSTRGMASSIRGELAEESRALRHPPSSQVSICLRNKGSRWGRLKPEGLGKTHSLALCTQSRLWLERGKSFPEGRDGAVEQNASLDAGAGRKWNRELRKSRPRTQIRSREDEDDMSREVGNTRPRRPGERGSVQSAFPF